MVEIEIDYEGQLHCNAKHGPSASEISTDAPTDNQGKGEAFSPTDLLATSMGTCMITTMGIYAAKNDIDLIGSRLRVIKEMAASPRRVARLKVSIDMPESVPHEHRPELKHIAETCPVQKSVHPDMQVELTLSYER
jgi:putative redox protein